VEHYQNIIINQWKKKCFWSKKLTGIGKILADKKNIELRSDILNFSSQFNLSWIIHGNVSWFQHTSIWCWCFYCSLRHSKTLMSEHNTFMIRLEGGAREISQIMKSSNIDFYVSYRQVLNIEYDMTVSVNRRQRERVNPTTVWIDSLDEYIYMMNT
jgi:hypothetical protein